jgi:ABC-type sulfate transport system permease subunit
MLLATMFVTLPFIVRELIPTLEQMDLAQEEAARSLGANPLQVRSCYNTYCQQAVCVGGGDDIVIPDVV